jgi:hypothetical protein
MQLSARQQIRLKMKREEKKWARKSQNLSIFDLLSLFEFWSLPVNKKILDSYSQTSCRQKAVGYLNLNEIFIPIPLWRVLGVGLESHRMSMYPFQQRLQKDDVGDGESKRTCTATSSKKYANSCKAFSIQQWPMAMAMAS